jgi:hypothetical protein
MLNKHQKGELYFGVKPDGTPIGQIVTEESLREVSQKIGNSIEPKRSTAIIRSEGLEGIKNFKGISKE